MIKLIHGDCIEKMRELPENSVDSIVTDPPYHLVSIVKRFGGENSRNTPAMNTKEGGVFARKAKGFMGKEWDGVDENGMGIANNPEMWREAMRVLKPGGYLLAFSGTRTYHRMAVAIEDAGFEVRDMIEWVYGSGFPKSLNIGKAVDKLQGNEREDLGEHEPFGREGRSGNGKAKFGVEGWDTKPKVHLTKGTSEWEGWGTALKPAHEPICMARKPLAEKTVAENVLKYGTGGINIDKSRVGTEVMNNAPAGSYLHNNVINDGRSKDVIDAYIEKQKTQDGTTATGRFPANLIHDNSEEVRECFPESTSGARKAGFTNKETGYEASSYEMRVQWDKDVPAESGNASRFFKSIIYQAKASKSERNKGCEDMEQQITSDGREKSIDNAFQRGETLRHNNHPTVKPIALMSYLIKMVTPEGGTVLDPFMGSGSTGVAAKENGYSFIGIDMTPEYVEIASKRIESVV